MWDRQPGTTFLNYYRDFQAVPLGSAALFSPPRNWLWSELKVILVPQALCSQEVKKRLVADYRALQLPKRCEWTETNLKKKTPPLK